MSFRIGAVATPHEFYIGAKRHLLKPVRLTGAWAEASVANSRASVPACDQRERAGERTSEASVRAECLRIIKSPTIDNNSRYLVIKIS